LFLGKLRKALQIRTNTKNKIIYIILSKKIQTIFSVLSILIVNKNFFRVARVFITEGLIDLIGQLFFSRFL